MRELPNDKCGTVTRLMADDQPHLETLRQRRDWLIIRAAGKKTLGWEHDYDEREAAALTWAIETLRGEHHGAVGL